MSVQTIKDGARDLAEVGNLIYQQRDEARDKAIDSLARYKFAMFGYWAGIWVHLNRAIGDGQPSPFGDIVRCARDNRSCNEAMRRHFPAIVEVAS